MFVEEGCHLNIESMTDIDALIGTKYHLDNSVWISLSISGFASSLETVEDISIQF